jgi:putative Mn2+ efflux pump MntP
MVLSIISLALFLKQCNTVCIVVAVIMGVFSFLESAFGYCVACKLYPLFRKIE